jgi:hypothetical protein
MAATPSLKIQYSVPRFAGAKTVSNRHHFNGGTPANSGAWTTFSDAVVTSFKACLPPSCTIIGTVGYAAGSEQPVFSKTYSTVGTLSLTGQEKLPSDCAVQLKWTTTARSSRNHPVYLWNWIHGVIKTAGTSGESVSSTQVTPIDTFANAWISGFSDGTNTLVRAGPNGATAVGHFTDGYVRHRDIPL